MYYRAKLAFSTNEGFNIKLTIKPTIPKIAIESKKPMQTFKIMSMNLKSDNLL
jgi:hypothetical protein